MQCMRLIGLSRHVIAAVIFAAPTTLIGQDTAASAAVQGKVVGPGGVPIDSVIIEIVGLARTRTDSAGVFQLYPLPAATLVLHAIKLGYRQSLKVVTTRANEDLFVPITLAPAVNELPRVIVRADSTPSLLADPSGFDLRRRSGMGSYITAGQIEAKHLSRTVDALRSIPGVEVDGSGTVAIQRGEISLIAPCVGAQVLIDGVAIPPPQKGMKGLGRMIFSPDEIPIESVRGIEVYKGAATTPMVLNTDRSACGTVAIWTK